MRHRTLLRPQAGARLLAPEVIQSSAMDCGPATLKCLAEGFSIPVSYDRLREVCQTGVDGTSIDALEDAALQLGLAAEQVMLPPDWLLAPESRALPAILVVRSPIGATHFLVVWNTHGSWVQLMDPAIGRRWIRASRLLAETHVHAPHVPATAWREWAGSQEFADLLGARLQSLGVPPRMVVHLLERARSDPGWRGLAALDAAVRMGSALVRAGALRAGGEAEGLVQRSVSSVEGGGDDGAVPARYWSVAALQDDPGALRPGAGEELVEVRGAVLVRVRGRTRGERRSGEADRESPVSQGLAAALDRPTSRPLRSLLRFAIEDGRATPIVVGSAILLAAALTTVEALILRGFLDLALRLALPEQRLAGAVAITGFLVLLLLLEIPLFQGTLQIGRRLEARLRRRFLSATAAQPDRYFRSRLSSDLAERCHSVHKLHDAPELVGRALRILAQVGCIAVGIGLLDPDGLAIACAAAAAAVALPCAGQPLLAERDLRVRDHAGALGRSYLDALLGIAAVRSHSGQRAVRRAHEALLGEWVRSAYRFEWAALHVDWLTAATGYAFAAWLVFRYVAGGGEPTGILLLAYWALSLPNLGIELAVSARQLPLVRSTARRLLEPLSSAPEDGGPIGEAPARPEPGAGLGPRGVSLSLEGVRVVAAGRTVLEDVDLEVPPGLQVAIVGASGAGKSTLVGILLGWHRPTAGLVRVDREELDEGRLARLRGETAWIDPSVQLWNRSLLANLLYGAPAAAVNDLGAVLARAELEAVLEGLPEGMATRLGEGGALVSGGEGQRVRLGRGLLRPDARLVILDEALRGLDLGLRRALLERAREWWRGATLLCVTHDLRETLDFDRVLVLEAGRLVEQGKPHELASRPGSRYSELLSAQERAMADLRSPEKWRLFRLESGRVVQERRAGSC